MYSLTKCVNYDPTCLETVGFNKAHTVPSLSGIDFSLQWLIESSSLHCFNSPHQVWCLPQKDPVPDLRRKITIFVSKLDSNSPLNKECKIKNPQTFIDIKDIPVKSIIYIFNKNNKNTLNVVLMKEENLYQPLIRSEQVSFVSYKRVPCSDSIYIDWLIHWLRTSLESGLGLWSFAYISSCFIHVPWMANNFRNKKLVAPYNINLKD